MKTKYFFLSVLVTLLTSKSTLATTEADIKANAILTAKVCHNMMDIKRPKGIKTSDCYEQAKEFLKAKNIKIMLGSYQAYFALSEKEPKQKICYDFLKDVVTTSQKIELNDAKELFENDKAQSLDQAFYSYQTCDDQRISEQKKNSAGSKTDKTSTKAVQ